MRSIDLSGLTWRKSSYSNTQGGNCLEVSEDLLSAADWHRSSYSNSQGGNCVEVASNVPSLIPVRDSKDPSVGVLLFTPTAWASFVTDVK